MPKPTERLGRGLSALIQPRVSKSDDPSTSLPLSTSAEHPRHELPVDWIRPNPQQPRTAFDDAKTSSLAQSIRENGLLQPIIVRTAGEHDYELIAGERRLRAARLAGLETIPVVIRDAQPADAVRLALIENLQREDLTPLERAAAYQQYLQNYGGTIEDLASRLGESRANVSNYIRLLMLRPEICYMLGSGELGMGQARALAGLGDQDTQLAIAKLAARRNLSVRQVEELVRRSSHGQAKALQAQKTPRTAQRERHFQDVEAALARALGLHVRLVAGRRKNSGRIVISFSTLEEFDRLAERLGGKAALE